MDEIFIFFLLYAIKNAQNISPDRYAKTSMTAKQTAEADYLHLPHSNCIIVNAQQPVRRNTRVNVSESVFSQLTANGVLSGRVLCQRKSNGPNVGHSIICCS